MKRLSFIVFLAYLFTCSVANAVVWKDGTVGNWSNPANWVGEVLPGTTEEAQINNGTVYMDCDATVGLVRMAYVASTDVATLDMTGAAGFSGHTLTINSSSSANLFVVGYTGKATVNQDTGTVKVTNTSTGMGAVNIRYAAGNPASYYNLSGGVMDTEVLRGGYTGTNLGLNDTGGTIIAHNSIYRLGAYTTMMTWTQGGSMICPGGSSSIGDTNIGQTGYETRWTTSASSKLQVELASDTSYDRIRGSGNATLTLGTLNIVASYTPAYNTTFDIVKLDLKTGKTGTGTFSAITDNLPGYFTAAWVNVGGTPDTLRLTYNIPEPATIALFGLGLLALVRRPRRK